MLKRLAPAITAALAALLLFASPSAAHASPDAAATQAALIPPPVSCPSVTFCAYVDNQTATTHGYELFPTGSPGECEVAALRNQWSSAYNNSGRPVRLYNTTNCTGSYKRLSNGAEANIFYTDFGPSWDNSVDAIRWE
jgi:peptidase inhibitor family I36